MKEILGGSLGIVFVLHLIHSEIDYVIETNIPPTQTGLLVLPVIIPKKKLSLSIWYLRWFLLYYNLFIYFSFLINTKETEDRYWFINKNMQVHRSKERGGKKKDRYIHTLRINVLNKSKEKKG